MWRLERRAGARVLLTTFGLWPQCLAKEMRKLRLGEDTRPAKGMQVERA